MLVTYLRSSLASSWSICPLKATLSYTLGIREPSNTAANVGNAAHKSLELRARQKLARQRGESTFVEPESGTEFHVDRVDREVCVNHGWGIYFPGTPFAGKDYETVGTHFDTVVRHKLYDPANLEIVQPEQFFDLEIDEPWAGYSFADPHTGEQVKGQLRIRGAMDLIYREAPGVLMYLDWKTGRKWDWAKGVPKTYDSLLDDDFQLLLYYYALRKLYPDEYVLMTIYFTKEDGPTTLPFHPEEHLDKARDYIRNYYQRMTTERTTRVMEKVGGPRKQPCSFCSYSKTPMPNGQSQCDYYWGELQTLGLDRLVRKHGQPNAYKNYGGGGGMSERLPGE